MISTTFKATLDIHDIYSQFRLRIKKGDTSGRLLITLTQLGKPYHITDDCYAVLAGVKEDGSILHNKCEIEDDVIVYHFTDKTTSTAGIISCDIIIYDSNCTELVSPHFTMEIYDSVYSEEEVESSNEFNSLNKLIVAANNLVNNVTEKLNNGEFVGEQGPQGPQGSKGEATEAYAQETPNFDKPAGTIWIETVTGNVYQHEGGHSVTLKGNIRGPQGIQGEKGEKGDKGEAGAIKFISVASLPAENIEAGAIYLVPVADSTEEENRFTEYAYIDGKWEVLGAISIQVDHSEYVKFTDYATDQKVGVVKNYFNKWTSGIEFLSDGSLRIMKADNGRIDGKSSDTLPIVPSNQDYAWKQSAIDNKEEWTDEEKASACETIGAVPFVNESISGDCFVPVFNNNTGKYGYKRAYGAHIGRDSIVMRNKEGVVTGEIPTTEEGLTPKKYVDDKIADIQAQIDTPTKLYAHNIEIKVAALATIYITIMNNNASAFTIGTLINLLQGGVVQASGVYINQGHVVGLKATGLTKLVVYVATANDNPNTGSASEFEVDTIQNTTTVTDRVVNIM
jgi:hypothetical protein